MARRKQQPIGRTDDRVDQPFAVNVGGYFEVTKATLPSMPKGSVIINTASITGLLGQKSLIDYSGARVGREVLPGDSKGF